MRTMSLTEGEEDEINEQPCYGKDEGDGLSRIHRTDDNNNNKHENNYQRLREFAETIINQTDSAISYTQGFDGTTKRRDNKLTG